MEHQITQEQKEKYTNKIELLEEELEKQKKFIETLSVRKESQTIVPAMEKRLKKADETIQTEKIEQLESKIKKLSRK